MSHSSPNVLRNALIATLGGTLLGLAVCLLWELLDRRVRSVEDAIAVAGLPVLGVMPRTRGPLRRRKMVLPSWVVKPALPIRRRKEAA